MYNITPQDYALLDQADLIYYLKVEIYDDNDTIIDVLDGITLFGGENIDATSNVRRTGSITIVPLLNGMTIWNGVDNQATIDLTERSLIWLDKTCFIYIGIQDMLTKQIHYYKVGKFVFTDQTVTYDATTNQMAINFSDMMAYLDGTINGQLGYLTTVIPAYTESDSGQPIEYYKLRSALIRVLSDIAKIKSYVISDIGEYKGMPQYNLNYKSYRQKHPLWDSVPYDMSFNAGCTIMDIIIKFRDLYPNYESFFDEDGTFYTQMIPSTYYDEPVITNDVLQKYLVPPESTTRSLSTIRNVCEVWGQILETDFYTEEAKNENGAYTFNLAGLENRYYSGDNVAIKVPSTNGKNQAININSFGKLPIYDENTDLPLQEGMLEAGKIYVFQCKSLKSSDGSTIADETNGTISAARNSDNKYLMYFSEPYSVVQSFKANNVTYDYNVTKIGNMSLTADDDNVKISKSGSTYTVTIKTNAPQENHDGQVVSVSRPNQAQIQYTYHEEDVDIENITLSKKRTYQFYVKERDYEHMNNFKVTRVQWETKYKDENGNDRTERHSVSPNMTKTTVIKTKDGFMVDLVCDRNIIVHEDGTTSLEPLPNKVNIHYSYNHLNTKTANLNSSKNYILTFNKQFDIDDFAVKKITYEIVQSKKGNLSPTDYNIAETSTGFMVTMTVTTEGIDEMPDYAQVEYTIYHKNDNLNFYLLGEYQVHALSVLTDGTTIKNGWTDPSTDIRYDTYSLDYFSAKYNVSKKNIDMTIIPNSPFTVQKIGERLSVKTGDEFEAITSDSLGVVRAHYENWKNCRLTDNVTITTLLMPWLDVNTKVTYKPFNSDTINQYIVKTVAHDFSAMTSTITMMTFYPLYESHITAGGYDNKLIFSGTQYLVPQAYAQASTVRRTSLKNGDYVWLPDPTTGSMKTYAIGGIAENGKYINRINLSNVPYVLNYYANGGDNINNYLLASSYKKSNSYVEHRKIQSGEFSYEIRRIVDGQPGDVVTVGSNDGNGNIVFNPIDLDGSMVGVQTYQIKQIKGNDESIAIYDDSVVTVSVTITRFTDGSYYAEGGHEISMTNYYI